MEGNIMQTIKHTFTKFATSLLLGSSLSLSVACDGGSSGGDDVPPPASPQPTETPNAAGGAATGTGADTSTGTGAGTSTGTGAAVTDGSAAGSGSGTSVPTTGGALSIKCELAWKSYVAANPAGLTLAYRVTTETKDGSGAVINASTSESETKVIESNDTRVVTSDGDLSKTQFLEGCNQVGEFEFGQVDADVTVLEEGPRTVIVPAGTFATNYTKSSMAVGIGDGETIISNWVLNDGSNITVKSDVSMSSSVAGFTFQNRTITELVKIVRP